MEPNTSPPRPILRRPRVRVRVRLAKGGVQTRTKGRGTAETRIKTKKTKRTLEAEKWDLLPPLSAETLASRCWLVRFTNGIQSNTMSTAIPGLARSIGTDLVQGQGSNLSSD